MTFKGGCDKEVFNTWLEKMLLPKLPLGTTIVMDNATFHKTTKTKSLIESFGCHWERSKKCVKPRSKVIN